MTKGDDIGREHEHEFKPDFHNRLARHWSEPREQLHAGGWSATHSLVDELGIGSGVSVLDVCCGEGGSAVWIARTCGARVIGIDILRPAIAVAEKRAQQEGVGSLCTFVWGNVFSLPFSDGTFDVVFGQDPDGFAHEQRVFAFKESLRVLRRGGHFGMQHWIPGVGAPRAVIDRFDQGNVEVGFPSHANVHADAYLQAMQAACFQDIRVVDRSDMYRKHMLAIHDNIREHNEEVDLWTAIWLELSEQHPFGVLLFGRKAQ